MYIRANVAAGSLALAACLSSITGCGTRGAQAVEPEPEPTLTSANSVVVPPISYGITDKGLKLTAADDGCDIPASLLAALESNLTAPYEHLLSDNARNVDGVQTLRIEIVDILANGGGQFSGPKLVEIQGTLSKGGADIGHFRARRVSFPLFPLRSTCNMVGRATYGLGYDIASWLAKPVDGAVLGDR